MKPSSRIETLRWENQKENPSGDPIYWISRAIIQYLDEEYERNKPCEHLETEEIRGMDSCKKCGAMGVFNQVTSV